MGAKWTEMIAAVMVFVLLVARSCTGWRKKSVRFCSFTEETQLVTRNTSFKTHLHLVLHYCFPGV